MALAKLEFDALLKQLPLLDAAQAKSVRGHLQVLSAPAETGRNLIESKGWLYSAICGVLERRGQLFSAPPLSLIYNMLPSYREEMGAMQNWLYKQATTRQEKVRAEHLLVLGQRVTEALITYLAERKIKNYRRNKCGALIFLLENIHHIPAALDNAFPGYVHAGVLSWLIEIEAKQRSSK